MAEFDRKRREEVRAHHVSTLNAQRVRKAKARKLRRQRADKLEAMEIVTDREELEALRLSALKDQLSAIKHVVQNDAERKALFELLKCVVKGKDPKRATPAYERERERMIQVLKLTQAWLSTPTDDEPPSDLFRGLLRMGASASSASSE